jgi:DNA-binding response OmpR family regulator
MNKCPCCGSPISSKVAVSLETNTASIDGTTIRFPATEAEILHVLIERSPALAQMDELINKVWGACGEGSIGTLQTHICKINKKIKPLGFIAANEYGEGYRLEECAA